MPSESSSINANVDRQERGIGGEKGLINGTEEAKEIHENSSNESPQPSVLKAGEARDSRSHRASRQDEPFEQWERDAMESLLMEVRGHLGEILSSHQPESSPMSFIVVYPTRFLEGEDVANNFLFNTDR